MEKEKWWVGLKKTPTRRCFKCERPKSYMNPLDKCQECLQLFCFDHIYGNQVKKGMSDGEEVRKICEKCREEHGYRTL
jgi:hypothetical protein